MQQEQDMKIYIPQTRGTDSLPPDTAPETDECVAIWKPSARSEAAQPEAPR